MILMYHNIDQQPGFNTVSVENFLSQIDFISSKFKIVDMDTYMNNLQSENHKLFATFTFDDAYQSILTVVLPIIEKRNIPITVFVPTAHVGDFNSWDSELDNFSKLNILNWKEIANLSKHSLITLGSHNVNHISLKHLDSTQTYKELHNSKIEIENQIGKTIDYYSYTYGQILDLGINNDAQKILENIGYKGAVTTLWGKGNKDRNPYLLRRIEVLPNDNICSFKRKICSKIDYRFIKQELKTFIVIKFKQ